MSFQSHRFNPDPQAKGHQSDLLNESIYGSRIGDELKHKLRTFLQCKAIYTPA